MSAERMDLHALLCGPGSCTCPYECCTVERDDGFICICARCDQTCEADAHEPVERDG